MRADEPGHPRYVPLQGAGRLDNPELYDVLYLSDAPAGAAAEAFGWARTWSEVMLRGHPSVPGSVHALAEFEFDDGAGGVPVCDLDDARKLVSLKLRPSQVVTRDRSVTQGWATALFLSGAWAGVRWWSYYDPRWGSHGIWALDHLRLVEVEPLTLDHAAVREAADVLNRPFSPRSTRSR